MNSDNSKTSNAHRLVFNLTDRVDLQRGNNCVALSDLSIYYTCKNIETVVQK